ncbi:collagen alpha-1(I) chain-like isoform X1 [Columba livia]|uniref:collagen alpha-1(I) chain-like isoform X1 n=1 Tax=Columba livia TaxID=8932 RepID=UPI0031BA45F1
MRQGAGTGVGAAAERSLRPAPGHREAGGSGPPFVRFPGGGRRAEGKEGTAGDLPPRASPGCGGCRCPRSPAGRRGSARGTERRKRRQVSAAAARVTVPLERGEREGSARRGAEAFGSGSPPPPPALTAALAKLLGGVRSGAASPSGAAPVPGAAAPPGAAQPPSVAGTVTSRAKARLRAGWVAWRAGRRSGGSSGRAPAGSVSCGRGFRAAALSVRFFVWSRLFFGFFLAGFPRNAARALARGCCGGSQWRRPVGKARYCTRPPQRGAAARLGAAALWRNSGTAAPGKAGGRDADRAAGVRGRVCACRCPSPPDGGQVPIGVKTTSLPRCLLKRLMT